MQTFGAELVGNQRTLPRTKLLQQLKKHRGRAAFRVEEERRARLVAELQQARLTGVPVQGAGRDHERAAGEPARGGVSVARGRIEVRFDGAENALERLFALAQALGNDYVRFVERVPAARRTPNWPQGHSSQPRLSCVIGLLGVRRGLDPGGSSGRSRVSLRLGVAAAAGGLAPPGVTAVVSRKDQRVSSTLEGGVAMPGGVGLGSRPLPQTTRPSTCCHTFRATGDHGVPLEWGNPRARPADRGARVPEDDEALRPDRRHGHRR